MKLDTNTYDEYADRYAQLIAGEDKGKAFSLYHKLVAPKMREFIGDVAGLYVLDAGCGEGLLSRELCTKGAIVTGIDISPNLIEYARSRSLSLDIEYMVADLSKHLPEALEGKFDMVVANLVIDDVPDYEGFIANLGRLAGPKGRIVISKSNPYSAVVRGKTEKYFDSGNAVLYEGLRSAGIEVYYFHRTLEEYISGFAEAGFFLTRLSDLKPSIELMENGTEEERGRYRKYYRFPFLMVLEFAKCG